MSLSVGGEPVKAPSKHTLYRRTHPPPGNHQLTHTLTRLRENRRNTRDREPPQNSRSCTESGPRESALHGTDAARMDNFSRSSSPRSASWCPRERRCLKGKSCCFTSEGIRSFARAPLNRERERRVIRCLFWSLV